MSRPAKSRPARDRLLRWSALFTAFTLPAGGCTTFDQYVHNGFKVGPNSQTPAAPVAERWIDAADPRVVAAPAEDGAWWAVFNDPILNNLIETAYQQNPDVKTAATRIFEAQAAQHRGRQPAAPNAKRVGRLRPRAS